MKDLLRVGRFGPPEILARFAGRGSGVIRVHTLTEATRTRVASEVREIIRLPPG